MKFYGKNSKSSRLPAQLNPLNVQTGSLPEILCRKETFLNCYTLGYGKKLRKVHILTAELCQKYKLGGLSFVEFLTQVTALIQKEQKEPKFLQYMYKELDTKRTLELYNLILTTHYKKLFLVDLAFFLANDYLGELHYYTRVYYKELSRLERLQSGFIPKAVIEELELTEITIAKKTVGMNQTQDIKPNPEAEELIADQVKKQKEKLAKLVEEIRDVLKDYQKTREREVVVEIMKSSVTL